MKILIKENKRDILAKKQLTKLFFDLDISVDYLEDSTGTKKRIEYRKDGDVIMLYMSGILYVCEDMIDELQIFSYSKQQLKNVVKNWFYERFDLPVNIVQIVSKNLLN